MAGPTRPPLLAIRRVSRRYGRKVVFEGVDLELRDGITALLGANGAGKTSLLDIMSTVRLPDAGDVVYNGVRIDGERAARQARRTLAYLPQAFGFPPAYTASDAIVYAAWLHGLPGGVDVEAALARVGLTDEAGQKVSKLSGGMRQRLGLAASLVVEPDLLLLDEPTIGLDPAQRVRFRQDLLSCGVRATVLSTHLVEDVVALADRVVILHNGGVVFDGPVAGLATHDEGGIGDSPAERGYMSLIGES